MSRPSDEMMVEVGVAWKDAKPCQDIEYFRPWWEANCGLDPRDDTDAALELLHWITNDDCLRKHNGQWEYNEPMFYPECPGWPDAFGTPIPISGEPFRYAVCNLAVEIVKNKPQV